MADIAFAAFYLVAIIVLVLHFNGWLEDHNMEWLLYVLALASFAYPVMSFIKH